MRQVSISCISTLAERFFVERSIELLYKGTIDSYRLRLHNPKTILQELVEVSKDILQKRLKNVEYAYTIAEEVLQLLEAENELKFSSINKSFLKLLLDKGKNGGSIPLDKVLYAGSIVLEENHEYEIALYTEIITEIDRLNDKNLNTGEINASDFESLNRLIGYFYIGLIEKGFSKVYLHRFVRAVFVNPEGDFGSKLNVIRELTQRNNENYSVILNVSFHKNLIYSKEIQPITTRQVWYFEKNTNDDVRRFLEKAHKSNLLIVKVSALDYYSAARMAKDKLLLHFDLMHIAFSAKEIICYPECAVLGENDLQKASIQNFNFHLDGHFFSGRDSYVTIIEKIEELHKKNISKNAIAKIVSGFRYLRLGSDSKEIENKLLNYWIGIEFLFSDYSINNDTIERIKKYYPIAHSLAYIKRLFKDFHQSLNYLKIQQNIPNYDDNLEY